MNRIKNADKTPKTHLKRETAAFTLSVLGQNLIFGLAASALTYYYQSVIFIPAVVIGILNASVQFLNIFKDPAMGIIIDKTHSKFGKCRPYLIIMPIFIGLSTVGLFINGIYSERNAAQQNAGIIAAAVTTYVLWSILYTAGDVPLATLPSVITSDANKKAKLISYSLVAGLLGSGAVSLFFIPFAQSLSGIFAPLEAGKEKSAQYGFITAVVIFTFIATALYQLAGLFTKEQLSGTDRSQTLKNSFSLIKKNRAYRLLLLSGILRAPADTATVTLTTITVYYYGNNGNTPYIVYMLAFFLSMGLGQAAATLFAPALNRRFEKKKVFIFSLAAAGLSTAAIFCLYLCLPNLLSVGAVIGVAVALFLAGAACGTLNVTQASMIADTVDLTQYETGIRPDGVFFSGLTTVNKFSVGVTALITGVTFAVVGFSGDGVRTVNEILSAGGVFATYPSFSAYRFAMFFLMCVPPTLGFFLSAIPIFKYKLTNSRHAEIQNELISRKNKQEKNSDDLSAPEQCDIPYN